MPQELEKWTDIHPDFSEISWGNNKKIYRLWEEKGLNCQDAQDWLSLGFTPRDHCEIKRWKDHFFTPAQLSTWLEKILSIRDYELATYVRYKKYQPNPDLNCEKLRDEFKVWKEQNKSVQEYLDCFYPLEQRNTVTKLSISWEKIIGSLDLSNFVNLEELNCSGNQLTILILSFNSKLKRIECSSNQLTELDLNSCSFLEHLDCSNNQLKELIISLNDKLISIDCSRNQLKNLILPISNGIEKIDAWNNLLNSFDFFKLNSQKITHLNLQNNDFKTIEVTVFSKLVNLEVLSIENYIEERIKQNIYNRFIGSLEDLQNLTKLKYLNIDNTDIDKGLKNFLEKTSENRIKNFSFSHNKQFPQFKIKDLINNSIISSTPSSEKINNCIIKQNLKGEFEWIDFANFFNIKSIAEGGHGNVFSSTYVKYWKTKVALKSLKKNTQKYEDKVIKEITNHHLFDDKKIIKCLGLSQNPHTQEYVMVMEYVREGDLRNYLKSDIKLKLGDKLKKIVEIASGLVEIHEKGLVHKDFHSGNILKKANECFITDLGQCEWKAEQQENNDKFFGVLPYVAPEVLQGSKYTSAADIYSLGIIMIEMINQLPPHCYEDWNDKELKRRIIEGFRPEIHFHIPKLLKGLINQCLNGNSANRPSAQQVKETAESWLCISESHFGKKVKLKVSNFIERDTEFYKQNKECERLNKGKKSFFQKENFHPSTNYHSRLIANFHLAMNESEDNEYEEYFSSYEDLDLNTFINENQKLKKEVKNLRRKLSASTYLVNNVDNSTDLEKKYQQLKGKINFLLTQKRLKTLELQKLATDDLTDSLFKDFQEKEKNLNELKEKLIPYEQIEKKIEQEEREINKLKRNLKSRLSEKEIKTLSKILNLQEEFIKSNNQYFQNQLTNKKNKLLNSKKMTEQEINYLLSSQKNVIELKISINGEENKLVQLTQIINNWNVPINNRAGNFGCEIGTVNHYQGQYSGLVNHGNIASIGDHSQGKIYQIEYEEESDYYDANESFSNGKQFEAIIEII
ncbi:MAG: Serine/threonine-protein kinase PknD [Mycoplasmataceae bacterium]|nr:Serine/threonine-protein kinase PknD [Mycoplasmataceae bacterium]WNE41206.1 MAG: Serine/threonine-protein kinase PknD [Mycoplasmataceae bacterium]